MILFVTIFLLVAVVLYRFAIFVLNCVMGQNMSLRHSEDHLSLFPSIPDSTNSLLDDHTLNNKFHKKRFQNCKTISKIKKSISECFGVKFDRLKEIYEDEEVKNSIRSKTEDLRNEEVLHHLRESEVTDPKDRAQSWGCEDLPGEIHEVHNQLTSLMTLLSHPELSSRDVSSQTEDNDFKMDSLLRQRDSLIFSQQERIKSLNLELENKSRTIERYTKEIAILKMHHGRQRLDSNIHQELITFLKSFKQDKILHTTDVSKVNDIIDLLTYTYPPAKSQVDKTNVAVINPCSKLRETQRTYSSTTNLSENPTSTYNYFSRHSKDLQETKLICFLDHSVTPYISTIPLSSSRITLSHVKLYTKSVLLNNDTCRYIFKSMISGSPQTQEEITQDSQHVPVHDNKIVVRIRMRPM